MEDDSAQVLLTRDVLDAFPFLAMIINEDYEVVIANTWFAKNVDEPSEGCPFRCYEAIENTSEPHPDCPLAESIRSNSAVERELTMGMPYPLQVAIYPLPVRDAQGRRLFLDLARSA